MLLSGNDAISYGALDSGVHIASGYPGTPSTSIIETLKKLKGEHKTFWHTNEKTALEMAFGSVLHQNIKALVAMKHVGLNVAADIFKSISLLGIEGSLLLVICDDPGMHSSQNEFDSRYYAAEVGIIVFEPSNSQEAYDMTKEAFRISKATKSIVMVRMTTRVAHSKSVVKGKKILDANKSISNKLDINTHNYSSLPVYSRNKVKTLYEISVLKRKDITNNHLYNKIEGLNNIADYGIIVTGVTYCYVKEFIEKFSISIPVLKLGVSLPLPVKFIKKFIKNIKNVVVFEEGYVLREQLLRNGIPFSKEILCPVFGNITLKTIYKKLECLSNKKSKDSSICSKKENINIPRPPVLCAGCSYRLISYAVKQLDKVILGDIGCYNLIDFPPLNIKFTAVNMGASIPMAEGVSHVNPKEKTFCMLGDGTFLHSGITGLIASVQNNANIAVIIMDNGNIAMTGHQKTAFDESVDMVALIKAIGVKDIHIVNGRNYNECVQSIVKTESFKGVSVIIVKAPCVHFPSEKNKIKLNNKKMIIDTERCSLCGNCLELGCPSITISKETGKPYIDESCVGCGDCAEVCYPCPVQAKVPSVIFHWARNSYVKEVDTIREKNVFDYACAMVCKEHCRYPAIKKLEDGNIEALSRKELNISKIEQELILKDKKGLDKNYGNNGNIRKTGKKIAIVGAGPAGLITARSLALKGHEVDIYEKMNEAGGLMRFGISEDKWNYEYIKKQILEISKLDNITIHYNIYVGIDILLLDIANSYNAIVIASGLWVSKKLSIPINTENGIWYALEWVSNVNRGQLYNLKDKTILVIGGGDTAVDVVMLAHKFGAKVEVVYKELTMCEKSRREINNFCNLSQAIPIEINRKAQNIEAICVYTDEKKDTKQILFTVDYVIVAIGQELDINQFKELSSVSCDGIIVNDDFRIEKNIFAVGDIVKSRKRDLPYAIGGAIRVAEKIDQYISGNYTAKEIPRKLMPDKIKDFITKIKDSMPIYKDRCDIFLGAVGGQGGLTIGSILGEVFIKNGWHCSISGLSGMAQRGGIVNVHIRGSEKHIFSPLIEEGRSQLGLFLEIAEMLRWYNMIENSGFVLANILKIIPPIITSGSGKYPYQSIEYLKRFRSDLNIIGINTEKYVDRRTLDGIFLLGILSKCFLFDVESWEYSIRKVLETKNIERNIETFNRGRSMDFSFKENKRRN